MNLEEAMKHAEEAKSNDVCSTSGMAMIVMREHILRMQQNAKPEAWLYECGIFKHILHERHDHYFSLDGGQTHLAGIPLVRAVEHAGV